MKLKHQSKKYSRYLNQSDITLQCPKHIFRAHLQTKLTTIVAKYLTSEKIENAITWEPLFRRKSTFPVPAALTN